MTSVIARRRWETAGGPAYIWSAVSGSLRDLGQNTLEFRTRERAQSLGTHITELADARPERGHCHVIRRLDDGDEVVLSQRPVGVLERCADLLRDLAHGLGALGTILDVLHNFIVTGY